MNTQDFNVILARRLDRIENVLGTKAEEYAKGGDRLHNFKTAARINETDQRKALWGMATKHLVSVQDIVNDNKPPVLEFADEKIGDLINYLILLEAICAEEREL